MSSTAYHISQYLTAQALGAYASQEPWGIFVGGEPNKPDDCITIYDTGGTHANADAQLWDPTFQVRVRSQRYMDAYTKAEAIRDLLLVRTAREIEGWHYTGFWLISDIAKIGRDGNDRELLTVNFRSMRQPIENPPIVPGITFFDGEAILFFDGQPMTFFDQD